jgi:hypothetical protein
MQILLLSAKNSLAYPEHRPQDQNPRPNFHFDANPDLTSDPALQIHKQRIYLFGLAIICINRQTKYLIM